MFDVFDYYIYKYDKMRPPEIERKLYSEVLEALYTKYGAQPDTLIMNRVQEEWKAIKREGMILETAFIHEFTSWLRAEKSPFYMSGECGSSLILYLLQITPINPLPPHLYCPECGAVEWNEDYKDGFDIPSNRCKNDGCECKGDGHNLVWRLMWDEGNYSYRFRYYLDVYRGLERYMEGFLDRHWMKRLKIREIGLFGEKSIWKNIHIYCSLDNWQDTEYYQVALDASCFDRACLIWRKYQIKETEILGEKIMRVPWPKNFSELISNTGLSTSLGTWNDTVADQLYEKQCSTSELLVFAEDLFFYLVDHGYSEYKAWKTVCKCNRRKEHFETILQDPKTNKDDNFWLVLNCREYLCMKSKAQEISFLLYQVQLAGIEHKEEPLNIFSDYSYLYQGLYAEEIEGSLYSKIMDALHDKYGTSPDELILKRLSEEWNAAKRTDTVLDIAFLHEFTSWMRKKRYPWMVSTGSCLIFYLLRITEANPLPAHAHCPRCHKIKWYHGMPSGYDINFWSENLEHRFGGGIPFIYEKCECGCHSEDYDYDGHNLIWQTVFGGTEYEHVQFELQVPVELESEMSAFISDHWLNEIADAEIYDPYQNAISEECLHLRFRYILNKGEYPKTFMDREGKKCFFYSTLELWPTLITENKDVVKLYKMRLPEPGMFGELVYNYGLYYGAGTWNELAKYMVEDLDYYTTNLIVFKEDVFTYLRKHGYSEENAWYGLFRAQFGLRIENLREELWWEPDRWVLEILSREKDTGTFQLWSKGQAVETILHRLRKYTSYNKKSR